MELTQVSFDVCPVLGLTSVEKYLYKVGFLTGIYLCWPGFFIITIAVSSLPKRVKYIQLNTERIRLKLIRGLSEIIK